MKKYRRKISIVTICALLLIALMALTCLQMFENTTAKADVVTKDNILTEAQIAEYTNNDLLNGYAQNGGISKYMDEYYNTDNYSKGSNIHLGIDVIATDPIVGIVPKELFTVVGQKLHIGQEYGFFIYSYKTQDQYQENVIYSIVLVFDIVYSSNTKENINDETSAFTYSIVPLFQREYAYLTAKVDTQQQKVSLKDADEGDLDFDSTRRTLSLKYTMADKLTNAVVKLPSISRFNQEIMYLYKEIEEFYLKDIVINSTLSNVNHPNIGDDSAIYSNKNDLGLFFTRIGTSFKGKSYDGTGLKNSTEEDWVNLIVGAYGLATTFVSSPPADNHSYRLRTCFSVCLIHKFHLLQRWEIMKNSTAI